jgi:L-lactate utilization protein LutC
MHDEKNVLEKVRLSLGRLGPLEQPPTPPALNEPLVRLVLSDIGLPALFQKKALESKIGVTPVRVEALHEELVAHLTKLGVRSVMLPRSKFLERLEIAKAIAAAGIVAKHWDEMSLDEAYDFDAAVTDVYRVIAETGSLVVRASPATAAP